MDDRPLTLADIDRCLQGEIPSSLATCSLDGEPNVVHVSQVIKVDDQHVAISNQFLGKTSDNLAVNPVAMIMAPDPLDGVSYKLLVRHVRSERDGPMFESVRDELDAIAAMTGMSGVFELRSVDVLRVLEITRGHSRNRPIP